MILQVNSWWDSLELQAGFRVVATNTITTYIYTNSRRVQIPPCLPSKCFRILSGSPVNPWKEGEIKTDVYLRVSSVMH